MPFLPAPRQLAPTLSVGCLLLLANVAHGQTAEASRRLDDLLPTMVRYTPAAPPIHPQPAPMQPRPAHRARSAGRPWRTHGPSIVTPSKIATPGAALPPIGMIQLERPVPMTALSVGAGPVGRAAVFPVAATITPAPITRWPTKPVAGSPVAAGTIPHARQAVETPWHRQRWVWLLVSLALSVALGEVIGRRRHAARVHRRS